MSDWYGLTGEYYDVDAYHDPEDGMTYRFAYTDAMNAKQIHCFNDCTEAAHKSGETDLRKVFRQAVKQFNEEAERRGWIVRIVLL